MPVGAAAAHALPTAGFLFFLCKYLTALPTSFQLSWGHETGQQTMGGDDVGHFSTQPIKITQAQTPLSPPTRTLVAAS